MPVIYLGIRTKFEENKLLSKFDPHYLITKLNGNYLSKYALNQVSHYPQGVEVLDQTDYTIFYK